MEAQTVLGQVFKQYKDPPVLKIIFLQEEIIQILEWLIKKKEKEHQLIVAVRVPKQGSDDFINYKNY